MSDNEYTFKEFMEKYGDCPEELFKIAKTDFERAVAIEFFNCITMINTVRNDVGWLKKLILGLFSVVVIGALAQWVPVIVKLLTGGS